MRLFRPSFLSVTALSLTGALLYACGGPGKGPEVAPVPSAVIARDGGAGTAQAPSTLPSGLPAYAPMPEPGVKGSAKVTLKTAELCVSPATANAKAPPVSTLLACDKGLKAVGAAFEGNSGEGDAAQTTTFRAEKGRCYRVYSTSDTGSLVVVLTDSAGARVAESPGPATPERALACFTSADTVTVSAAVGRGKGHFAVQVASD